VRQGTKRFGAIEGLRAYLAWTVVFSHLAQITNIYAFGLGPALQAAGSVAVLVFMIVSGFVITHLLIERREPYGPYLFRRFMRIFPVFAVTCAIGYFTTKLGADAVARVPWAADPDFSTRALYGEIALSTYDHFWPNLLAHAGMLHGLISGNILNDGFYAFNGPAWSLSVEWQFYLLAPALLVFARRARPITPAAIVAFITVLSSFGVFGGFPKPSNIMAAAGYFAIGMASRLVLPHLQLKHAEIVLAVLIVSLPLSHDGIALPIWGIVMISLLSKDFDAIFSGILKNRVALYLGTRSYSTYLIHFPLISAALWLWLEKFPAASKTMTLIGLSLIVLPITAILSVVLYRCIEAPGIAFAAWIARQKPIVPIAA
jgi:peptidoglycan/LPS O-acetylase OafA/YrhL